MIRITRMTIVTVVLMLCLTGLVMSGEAQTQRFVDNGNGTVTDTVTGLMWTKDANPVGWLNWDDAWRGCSSFSISGIGGWRLPSRDELSAIYHAIQSGHPFTGVQSYGYWSSTAYAGRRDGAWAVSMRGGQVDVIHKSTRSHVWPVRAGQ
ncbi:DUF1566 domain-containing protein [Desulfonatronovibrio magnus]|uniref:Lcl C-terminal domain-containing protein n=1 Tax=Desulfonatronovibrio magnus TaxID=698827 RepID=UPI000698913E|nr:DUF1566 domain-containing protein [Desulfonatronovibrio magnus]